MERRVAIIGGGLAGLTCAYALQRRGIPSIIFEASPSPGGRSTVEQIDGFTIDAGAQYLLGPALFRDTFDLIRSIGLGNDIVAIPAKTAQVYKGTVYHHNVASATGLLRFKGLNWADKMLLPRMAYLISRFGSAVDFHHPERGVELDDESVAVFIKRELSQNILNYIAGPLVSSLFYYGSEETSKLLYLMLAKHMFNLEMYTLRGGIGRISGRLAETVEVRSGKKVMRLGGEAGRYEVEGLLFSDVVVAVRGDAVLDIEGVARLLSDEDREFFHNCRYERAVTLVIGTSRPVDGQCYGVSIPRVEKLKAATIAFHDFFDPTRVPEGRGLLAITGGGPDVSADILLAELEELYRVEPGVANITMTYTWRSAMPKFPPGRYRELAAFQQRVRSLGLYFCGDYLLGPFVEGAVSTGLAAAASISTGA